MLRQSIYPFLTEYICLVSIFWKDFDLNIVPVFISIEGHSHDKNVVWVFG